MPTANTECGIGSEGGSGKVSVRRVFRHLQVDTGPWRWPSARPEMLKKKALGPACSSSPAMRTPSTSPTCAGMFCRDGTGVAGHFFFLVGARRRRTPTAATDPWGSLGEVSMTPHLYFRYPSGSVPSVSASAVGMAPEISVQKKKYFRRRRPARGHALARRDRRRQPQPKRFGSRHLGACRRPTPKARADLKGT